MSRVRSVSEPKCASPCASVVSRSCDASERNALPQNGMLAMALLLQPQQYQGCWVCQGYNAEADPHPDCFAIRPPLLKGGDGPCAPDIASACAAPRHDGTRAQSPKAIRPVISGDPEMDLSARTVTGCGGFRTSACRRSAPLFTFEGVKTDNGHPAPPSNRTAERWLRYAANDHPTPNGPIMTYETIVVETKGKVGIVRLNRPQALNALNARVNEEITAALDAFEADANIACVILTGSEKAFAAGADIKEMAGKSHMDAFMGDFAANWDRVARM